MSEQSRAKYYDGLGSDFEAWMSDYDVERRISLIFDLLLRGFEFGGALALEVGCGTGRFTKEIAGRGARVVATDIGFNLVHQSSSKSLSMGAVGDACLLPFPTDTFDVVVSSECIEHTPHPLVAVSEMCRVCRPDGFVCFTTPNRLWYPALVVSQKLKLRKFAGIENWISPGQAIHELKKSAISEIHVSGCHLWPFQLAFSRGVLRRFDSFGDRLYPLMINFGASGRKSSARTVATSVRD